MFARLACSFERGRGSVDKLGVSSCSFRLQLSPHLLVDKLSHVHHASLYLYVFLPLTSQIGTQKSPRRGRAKSPVTSPQPQALFHVRSQATTLAQSPKCELVSTLFLP